MTKKCDTPQCEQTLGPIFPTTSQPTSNVGCEQPLYGKYSCGASRNCTVFELDKAKDSCFVDGIANEITHIAGATLNVYKLLGVHEQGNLIDVTGKGIPLSNGDWPLFEVANAFDIYVTEWRSIQRGSAVLASAYIGYDFGEIKTQDESRRAYSVDTSIYKHITALSIKQSSISSRRATRIRIERSDDGNQWYGVTIIPLPDDDCLNTIMFKSSSPSRYWRIRPLDFNGVLDNEVWSVVVLQLYHNYQATNLDNIQDHVFLENRDREYAQEPIALKGTYEIVDIFSELTARGMEISGSLTFIAEVGFSGCVSLLNRPLVIGDIIEIPSEAQYTPNMEIRKRWLEVTEVAWSTNGYTPGWQPTILRITMKPAIASQETQDIFGDLVSKQSLNEMGLMDNYDGNSKIVQDYSNEDHTIKVKAKDAVPEYGAEGSSVIREFEDDEILVGQTVGANLSSIGLNSTGLYVEDAMPPNNQPYTEGTSFPSNPTHGDYHRMTYEGLSSDIPTRLYRFSQPKNRWIFLEYDKRAQHNHNKPTLQEFIKSGNETTSKLDRDKIND